MSVPELLEYRPSWEDTWLAVAWTVGERTRCSKAQVGAVVVSEDNSYVVPGYNGPPAGMPVDGMCRKWCPRAMANETSPDYSSCPSIHAESNALLRADFSRIRGGTIFVSRSVCINCAALIANSGVRRVVHAVRADDAHRDPDGVRRFLEAAGLKVDVAWYGIPGYPPRLSPSE